MYGYKKIFSLLVPALLETVSVIFISMMSSMMVSHLGEKAINAVNLSASPCALITTLFFAIGSGITVKVSQYIGKGAPLDAKRAAEQGTLINLIATILLSILLVLFASPILSFLFRGLDAETMQMSRIYFVCTALSLPLFSIFRSMICTLRGAGDYKIIFAAELCHNVLYLVLGYMFIHLLGLGILGLGIGLILCRAIGGLVMYLLLRRGTNCIKLDSVFRRPQKQVLASVLSIGIPTSIDGFFAHGGALFLQTLIVSFGSIAITANALTGTLRNYFLIPQSAMGTVAVTLIAQAFGSGDLKETRRTMWRCTVVTLLLATLFNLSSIFYLDPLIGLYHTSAETSALIKSLITMTIVVDPLFNSFNLMSWSALQAVGDVKFAITASIIRFCIVRLLGSYLLTQVFHFGIHGIWYAVIADLSIAAVIFTARFLSHRWERFDRI